MAKALKRMLASQLEQELGENPGLLLIDPGPMTVETVMAFRRDLREKAGGARMRVIHNRTARVAFDSMGLAKEGCSLLPALGGGSAVVFGGDGAVPIAKVVRDWSRRFKKLKLKAAVADGEVLLGREAEVLADIPDLPQLQGMLLGALVGSARGIAVSLQSVYAGIARALKAHVDEQGGAPEDEPAAEAPAEPATEPAAAEAQADGPEESAAE